MFTSFRRIMMNLQFNTNEKGNLEIGGVDALELAQEYGTPLYVLDEMRIRDNYPSF